MSTPNSNEKSINNLKDEVINGDGILGGGKSSPVIIEPVSADATTDISIPNVLPVDGSSGPDANGPATIV